MLDISKEPLKMECPNCGKEITVTFQDALENKHVECLHCGQGIQLAPDSKLKKGLKEVDDSFKKMKEDLEKLNKMLS